MLLDFLIHLSGSMMHCKVFSIDHVRFSSIVIGDALPKASQIYNSNVSIMLGATEAFSNVVQEKQQLTASNALPVTCNPRCSNCSQAWHNPCKPRPVLSCPQRHLAGALWVPHSPVPCTIRQLFLLIAAGPALQLIRLASRHLLPRQTGRIQACLQRLPRHRCCHSQARQRLAMRQTKAQCSASRLLRA